MRLSLAILVVALAVATAAVPQPTGRGRAVPIKKHSVLTNSDDTVNLVALTSHLEQLKRKFENGSKRSSDPSSVAGHQKRGTGLPLTMNPDGDFWYGSVAVGTPPKAFTVLFDTGSTDMFLPSSDCGSTCNGHSLWNHSSSSTSVDTEKRVTLKYEDGSSATVEIYTDTVSIAGFTAKNQSLGAALGYPAEFAFPNFTADGLVGLSFESLSLFNSSSLFGTLVNQGVVTDPVFSMKLSDDGAELYLGGTNNQLYNGGFTYVPVVKEDYWQVPLDNLQANGTNFFENSTCIIDSGTTLIAGPSLYIAELNAALGGMPIPGSEGLYAYPCGHIPSLNLTFGGKTFPISNETLVLGPVSPGSPYCAIGMQGLPQDQSTLIIGDVFLRNVYTTFDYGNTRIGFAQLA